MPSHVESTFKLGEGMDAKVCGLEHHRGHASARLDSLGTRQSWRYEPDGGDQATQGRVCAALQAKRRQIAEPRTTPTSNMTERTTAPCRVGPTLRCTGSPNTRGGSVGSPRILSLRH